MAKQKLRYSSLNKMAANPVENGVSGHSNSDAFLREPYVESRHNNGSVKSNSLSPEEEGDETCGWGRCQPTGCQRLRNAKLMLFCLCWAGAIQGLVVNGLVSVVISTIERRFDLSSTETGIIASSYDIMSVLCLIPVSYFGGRPSGHKPMWLGGGMILLALGSFIFALPHFTTSIYKYETVADNVCLDDDAFFSSNSTTSASTESLSMYRLVFVLGQLFHGAGAAPLYTLGVTYLDENLKAKVAPVYIGLFYALAIVGPAVGYVAGSQLLGIWTDVGATTLSSITIEPGDPKWVGCWWMGFLISGVLALAIALPLCGFPKSLPGSAQIRAEKVSEVYKGSESATSQPGFGMSIKDFPVSLKILLTNPTFMFLCLSGATEALLVSGFTAFIPKFIESQFSISASWAGMLVGFATIPAGGGGTLFGGYLVKKLKLKCRGIIKMCCITSSISLLLLLIFFIQCNDIPFSGINTSYNNGMSEFSPEDINLNSTCNTGCNCVRERYNPVCGSNKKMYFSPCYAGCTAIKEGSKTYLNCSCLATSNSSLTLSSGNITTEVTEGKCASDCIMLYVFLPVFALIIFFTFMTTMPALSCTLRCVAEEQRSFALGIQWILIRCLGSIPGPILLGALIDQTCLLWQKASDESPTAGEGSCYIYNNGNMSTYLMVTSLIGKALTLIFIILALVLYKAPKDSSPAKKDIDRDEPTSMTNLSEPSPNHQKYRIKRDLNEENANVMKL
ncbi:unnamed protein product [Owenia fusiformis]|uniref:Solute carrier organic anion transporter family member n=1 Tax=Owenia fusiformis TaxID=6347 RepID=A0A8S4N2V0_OWEFU|nr:unnamed protein product [Owenia fusiformis]